VGLERAAIEAAASESTKTTDIRIRGRRPPWALMGTAWVPSSTEVTVVRMMFRPDHSHRLLEMVLSSAEAFNLLGLRSQVL
jgi:hypothetical protein